MIHYKKDKLVVMKTSQEMGCLLLDKKDSSLHIKRHQVEYENKHQKMKSR